MVSGYANEPSRQTLGLNYFFFFLRRRGNRVRGMGGITTWRFLLQRYILAYVCVYSNNLLTLFPGEFVDIANNGSTDYTCDE